MQKVYSSPDRAMVYNIKNILQNHGIETTVHKENLRITFGVLSPNESWVELWLVDERQFTDARQVVEEALKDEPQTIETWTCRQCGEKLEGQFAQCWKCGVERLT
jgi:hypothetical protein